MECDAHMFTGITAGASAGHVHVQVLQLDTRVWTGITAGHTYMDRYHSLIHVYVQVSQLEEYTYM